ncbi:LCP family protein [Mycolicibacterium arenosum]|uniref:LCP family protein n=1 Tax=Mycolicibacterium arenosum TaxID=2952157 RepID=A0ABT1M0X1_9MYCO|nr:LCP family protein [Mycolicibacterium sp. CAU 1645]MCP9271482.1 LCP family protein [Mycolicibacterium sp. CAU 1645]
MSDGDNATPGRPPPSDDDHWLTRTPRPKPGAAPWERREEQRESSPPATGNHADGITVADLIAKVSGTSPPSDRKPEPTRHSAPIPRQASVPPPRSTPPPPQPVPEDEYAPPTDIIPVLPAHASELPNLSAKRVPAHPARIGARRDPEKPKPKRKRTAMLAGRAVAALLAVCAVALTGSAWQWQSLKNQALNKVSALDQSSRDILDPNAQFGDENFLIVGTDSRIGQNSEVGAGSTDDAGGARSDTVMLVNIPANRKRVVAVSFPRDLSITPMTCEPWDPETGNYGMITDEESPNYGLDEVYTETKLNSAYAVGGPKCLVKVIQKLSGLSINRFMAVDFAGFQTMVDALGGVEVCSTTPIEDYELGTVLPTAGRQIIDGHTALQYVRARQVTTETNGDYGRIKRQQLFLSSLLRSLISKDTFFSLSKLNNVVNMFIADSYVDNIDTKDLVNLGQSIQGVNAGRITFITVPTVGYADEYGNEVPRDDDMRALFDAIINDDPLPEEKNADNTPVPETPTSSSETAQPESDSEVVDAVATDPSSVTVRVSNSTGENGLASTAASELQQHGFVTVEPDDYPGPLDATTVFFSAGNEEAAATVASAFSSTTIPTIERVTGLGDEVRVVLGSDFQTVGTPSPSGSAVQVNVVRGSDASSEPTQLPEDLNVTNAADTTCE